MLILFQVLFLIFAIFAIFGVVSKKNDHSLSAGGITFWVLFWITAGIAVMWPESTQMLAEYLGIGRGTDLVLYLSVAVIFYLLFKMHVRLEVLNRDMTKVVRRDALDFRKDPEQKYQKTERPLG